MQNSKYISIGKILNFHGVQGEAKVGYSKNQADFLRTLSHVYIYFENEYKKVKVKSIKFNNKFAILINSINDILVYKNCLLYVPQEEFEEALDEGEYLIDDLVGLDVYSNDKKVGVVVGVSNNGANDLLSVRGLSKKISLDNKKVYINEIQGLIE